MTGISLHRPLIGVTLKITRQAVLLTLGFALVAVPPQIVLAQFDPQQQQREQQERERQQREQQQREQQEREQQERERQQREQQEREREQRDQEQREQQEREQQQREQEQREQQRREQQERERQQREQQERSEEQQRSASDSVVMKPNASSKDSRPANSDKRPDGEPTPKPVQQKPIASDPERKVCKEGPCQGCPPGEAKNKDGSCIAVAKSGNARSPADTQQACAAGQVWNGAQCQAVGVQQCLPGQVKVGTICQADCTGPTAGAQNIILELRNAHSDKENICRQNPNGTECQHAEALYNTTFTEYENYLGTVPVDCRATLPDPITI